MTSLARSRYRINRVDGTDEDIADTIKELHEECFGNSAPQIDPSSGHWWLAFAVDEARDIAGFAGITASDLDPETAYFCRVGVRVPHRGQGLQRRFTRVFEALARRKGFKRIVSDTTDNPPSANNLIASGYRMFTPAVPWGFRHSCYWYKAL